jgi:hypothetical protein
MTYTDEQVAQYFIDYPGLNESQIAQVMSERGVSPEQVARVTGADPGYVSQRYLDLAPAPAAVDPVAQQYANDFNALINQGNYEGAARVVKEAELAGYGDEAYRAAAVALDANTNLPQETDFISPQGIQSIRDYVNTATAPPPAPVDPNVEKFNNLIRANNFDEAGVLATNSGFTPEQVLTYLNDPNIFPEFGGNVTLDTVKSFVPKPPAVVPPSVDPGIAGALTDDQGTTPLSFTDQLNALFQANLGRLPTDREASIYSEDFRGTFSPELEAAFMSRSTEEMGNRQKGITEADDAAAKTETAKTTAPGVYQPTYTSYRQEGQAPFGGYYALPGIGPYGGVFGVGTEQFEQQSDPFSGAQARARSLISNRLTPLTDNIPIDARQPAPFGGDMAANGVAPSPFAYRQTLSPNTLAALAAEATPASEAAASEATMRRGGYIDQGIAAVRR